MSHLPLLPAIISAASRESLDVFASTFLWVQDKLDAEREGIQLHEYQRKIVEVLAWCEANKVPARLVCCKPRRGGSSTISVAALYHALQKNQRRGCILGGREFQCDNLFKMLRLMAKKDRTVKTRAEVLDKEARFPNGSYATRVNASSESSAVSAGFTFLICTEVAKWKNEGVAAASAVLAAALKCVPYLPGTTVIVESTADGVGDEFHRIYSSGITFEELKAGKTGFVKIFSPWQEFRDSVLEPTSMDIASEADLTQEEKDLSSRYQLSLANVAFMRRMIVQDCAGDFDNFRENYPFDDTDCFLLSGRKAFSARGLAELKKQLPSHLVQSGVLDYRRGETKSVVWRPTPAAEARLILLEHPRDGMKYVLGVDPMTGASQTGSSDPDNHGVIVWRAGYFDAGGRWLPPSAVAMLVDDWEAWLKSRKYSLCWDIDVLAEAVWRLALYFGNCLIVPEMNMDRGLVELLKLKNANLYVRKLWNKREQTESNAYGWVTNTETRGRIVSELARGIREFANFDPIKGHSSERIELFLPPLLDECETFIVRETGRSEAMQGKHDDLIFSAGLSLVCLDQATSYRRPAGSIYSEPEWMRNANRDDGNLAASTQYA